MRARYIAKVGEMDEDKPFSPVRTYRTYDMNKLRVTDYEFTPAQASEFTRCNNLKRVEKDYIEG